MKNKKIPVPKINWNEIETVMLDMDGTLLDKHFDDYFWEEHVPEVYARENKLNFWSAHETLMAKYKSREGTLDWTDINYWSDQLGLDLADMKEKMNHLIQVHPYVIDFLKFCQSKEKKIHLVTNAHSKTLSIKMAKTEIESYFDRIICSEEIGLPKEDPAFWKRLAEKTGFKKQSALLADDNEAVLASAKQYGIRHLVFVAKSSSMKPVVYAADYPSIIFFKELME